MAPFAVVNGTEYCVFTEPDSEEMARLLGEAFAKHDPPAVAVGVTVAEFQDFVQLFCAHAALQGLTIIARSAGNGEMIGALLAEDSNSQLPAGMECLSPKFTPIFDILSQLDSAYRSGRMIAAGESAHLFLLGVAERSGGRGVGHELVAHCIANAARKGYSVAVTEATNRTSQHIFRKRGFVERVRGSYQNHRYDGQAYFASIAEHVGPILMDRLLAR